MAILDKKVSEIYSGRDISSLSDRPNQDGLDGTQLKARFDQLGKEVIPKLNALIDELFADLYSGTSQVGHTHNLDNIVDGITYKLFTALERAKLIAIEENAEVNQNAFSNVKVGSKTIASSAKTDTFELVAGLNITMTVDALTKKVFFSATGDLATEAVQSYIEDIGNYFTSLNVEGALQEVGISLLKKVDKVEGKGLSTNDYTTEDKNKVANLPSDTNSQLAEIATLPNGADKTGVISARAIIQNALTSGVGELLLPEGNFYLDYQSGMTELLLITKPIKIRGINMRKTKIYFDSNTPNTCDVIRISPEISSEGLGYGISDLSIIPLGGAPARHGINLDVTNTGQQLKNLVIERVRIAPLGGKGIQTTNPTNRDGFFTSVIRDNFIANGIYLERAGDSIQIERNKLWGKNYGIYADLVSGANSLLIYGNNITNDDGCVFINGGETDPRIVFNNFEPSKLITTPEKALVVLKGGSAKLRASTVAFNTFLMKDNLVETGLYVDNAQRTVIDNNYFGRSDAVNQKAIVITSNANDNWISKNFISGALVDSGYEDNGVRTKGIYKTLVLSTGFTAKASIDQPSYSINDAGNVNLIGAVNRASAWADSQIIAVLPSGARPKSTQYFPATSFITNTGYVAVTISIESTGNIKVWGVNGRTVDWVSLSGVNFLGYA